jgi:hypothetical protein
VILISDMQKIAHRLSRLPVCRGAAWHKGYVVNGDYKQGSLAQRVPTAADHINQRVCWGEPAKICEAKFDKCCPHCGKTQADGFDLGMDDNGNVFGARCGVEHGGCGFSF